ncbi:hypothetical protein KCV03_g414, partial [Aureobasidium melanogenum]
LVVVRDSPLLLATIFTESQGEKEREKDKRKKRKDLERREALEEHSKEEGRKMQQRNEGTVRVFVVTIVDFVIAHALLHTIHSLITLTIGMTGLTVHLGTIGTVVAHDTEQVGLKLLRALRRRVSSVITVSRTRSCTARSLVMRRASHVRGHVCLIAVQGSSCGRSVCVFTLVFTFGIVMVTRVVGVTLLRLLVNCMVGLCASTSRRSHFILNPSTADDHCRGVVAGVPGVVERAVAVAWSKEVDCSTALSRLGLPAFGHGTSEVAPPIVRLALFEGW